jgi:hypothetical protein
VARDECKRQMANLGERLKAHAANIR